MSAEKIRALNDAFRRTLAGGKVMMTAGIAALPIVTKSKVLYEVRTFNAFSADNDPHGEHDFGSFEVGGKKVFGRSTTTTRRWSSARKTRPIRPRQPASLRSCSRASTDF
jgi:hypothetical protein